MLSSCLRFSLIAFILFFCLNISPRAVVENYGNWRVLSFSVKGSYITGVWDSFITEIKKNKTKKMKYQLNCLGDIDITIGDFVEKIDLLYKLPENKSYSPSSLLIDNILKEICIE